MSSPAVPSATRRGALLRSFVQAKGSYPLAAVEKLVVTAFDIVLAGSANAAAEARGNAPL